MATKDDEPPNSGLWGHVEVEALPNPGSLPPPPLEGAAMPRGTLLGFVVPPPGADTGGPGVGPLRRTPSGGTPQPRISSKTLTSGVVPPFNSSTTAPSSGPAPLRETAPLRGPASLNTTAFLSTPASLTTTAPPATSPVTGAPKDTVIAAGGEPKARGYYHSTQANRTLIGGSLPAPPTDNTPGGGYKRATAPGFPTLPETKLDKTTLIGVARNSDAATQDPALHPTYRSPPTQIPSPATDPEFRAIPHPSGHPTHQDLSPRAAGPSASHLGRFRIQKRLGAGGVGAVYLASKVDRATSGHQLLAVKVLREHFYRDPSTLKALFREARLAARMDHRHIVRVFDIGYHNKHPYLVMEYVDGLSLAALLAHSVELPLGIGIRCVIDVLHGLDFAHKLRGDEAEPLGLVHCDVSPQNVLVGVDGVTKLTDFGVARTREEDGDEFVLRCKPEYAAPELLRGDPVRPETDVFGAGAVLYRIATGTTAFTGETEDQVIDHLLNRDPIPPSQIRGDLPSFLDAFCAQAMAKSVNDRFRTCLEMARALERQAEAAGLLADRLSVGAWVQNVRRAQEHGETPEIAPRRASNAEETTGIPPTLRARPSNKQLGLWAAAAILVLLAALAWARLGTSTSEEPGAAENNPAANSVATPYSTAGAQLTPGANPTLSTAAAERGLGTPLAASTIVGRPGSAPHDSAPGNQKMPASGDVSPSAGTALAVRTPPSAAFVPRAGLAAPVHGKPPSLTGPREDTPPGTTGRATITPPTVFTQTPPKAPASGTSASAAGATPPRVQPAIGASSSASAPSPVLSAAPPPLMPQPIGSRGF